MLKVESLLACFSVRLSWSSFLIFNMVRSLFLFSLIFLFVLGFPSLPFQWSLRYGHLPILEDLYMACENVRKDECTYNLFYREEITHFILKGEERKKKE